MPVMVWKMRQDMDRVIRQVEERFAYPVFIKPSNAGSSRGVSKAENREQLIAGLEEAARHDRKILVEETIIGHEVECAVLGGGEKPVQSSGEILQRQIFMILTPNITTRNRTVINPELPEMQLRRCEKGGLRRFSMQ